jgi:hypothetical protein
MYALSLRAKLRFVLSYGVIIREKNKYSYRPNPFKDSPVLQNENRSKWKLVEETYELIKSYT